MIDPDYMPIDNCKNKWNRTGVAGGAYMTSGRTLTQTLRFAAQRAKPLAEQL